KKLGTFNAIMFPIFLVLFFGGIIYEIGVDFAKRLPPPASDMGVSIEKLIIITTIITVPVFVLVHIALFLYPFFYRHKEGQKAYFYSHNDRLEFIWTSIPAVVLAGIILFGFKTWTKVTGDPEKNAEYVECYAYQFGWDFRYPGADKKLGKTDFLKIDPAKNLFGLDYSDVGTHDDFKSQELHLCVGREFVLKMRSRDVTHGGYLPHFRTQIYANPGMDNSVKFVPLFTTKQMREKLDKPNFNYEFACNQLCGAAHYTMRRIIVVDTPEDYEKWKAAQKPIYDGSQKTALK
ncbi:MAG: cytochrome c oxidase subunit II, partial [Bacteroidetes bacterium]|nr:cytochrome c oxidase subunit II [Bacteroidota bacterium]